MMRNEEGKLSKSVFLILFIFFGSFIRIFFIINSDFPLNDGGLFYTMINDLVANNFRIPIFTTYNLNHIPFTYPLLSLYLAGFLKYIGVDLITVFRFFPLIFNIISIPAFYSLCRKILKTETEILFATLAFAVLPPAYEWLIMGGGLTRSPAYLLSILAWNQSYKLINTHSIKELFITIILTGLCGLCHIEICMITVILILLSFVMKENRTNYVKYSTIFLCGVAFIMTPYFYSIIHIHGLTPLKSALLSGEFNLGESLIRTIFVNITGETYFTPFLVFALLGFGVCIQKKEYLIPIYILSIVLFNPRSLDRSLIMPVSFLSGVGFKELFYPIISNSISRKLPVSDNGVAKKGLMTISWIGILLIGYFVFRTSITSMASLLIPNASLNHISQDERAAMDWVKKHTNEEEKFLVLSKSVKWQIDYRSEWFPAIAERRSIVTVQGSEWLNGGVFYFLQDFHEEANNCFMKNLTCLNTLKKKYSLDYSMIFLSGKLSSDHGNITSYPIEMELRASPSYELLFENETVTIFELKN